MRRFCLQKSGVLFSYIIAPEGGRGDLRGTVGAWKLWKFNPGLRIGRGVKIADL